MKITKSQLRQIIKEELEEAFRLEKDFRPGSQVTWNTLEKVEKTTASGRTKTDYERVQRQGEIKAVTRSGGRESGLAKVIGSDGNTHEVEISELTLV